MDWLKQNRLILYVAECESLFLGNNKLLSKISESGSFEISKNEI